MTLSNYIDFEFMLFWTQMTKRLCFNMAMRYFCAILYTNCWSHFFHLWLCVLFLLYGTSPVCEHFYYL